MRASSMCLLALALAGATACERWDGQKTDGEKAGETTTTGAETEAAREQQRAAPGAGDTSVTDEAAKKAEEAKDEAARKAEEAKDEAAKKTEGAKDEATKKLEGAKDEAAKEADEAKDKAAKKADEVKAGAAKKADEAKTGAAKKADEAKTGASKKADEAKTGVKKLKEAPVKEPAPKTKAKEPQSKREEPAGTTTITEAEVEVVRPPVTGEERATPPGGAPMPVPVTAEAYVNHSTVFGDGASGMYTDGQGTYGGRATWGTGGGLPAYPPPLRR